MFDIDNDKAFFFLFLTHFAEIFESFEDYKEIAYIYDMPMFQNLFCLFHFLVLFC